MDDLRSIFDSLTGGSVAVEIFISAAFILAFVGFANLCARAVAKMIGRPW